MAERLALAQDMERVGPDAPTLCSDWTVRDLAAHVVVRERRPDAAIAIILKPLAARAKRVQDRIAAQDFGELLAQVRNPPWWSPVSNPLTDELANLTEMFIHHEDVRRAVPGWEPRDLPAAENLALWKQLRVRLGFTLRRFRATVEVESPGFGSATAGGSEPDTLTITGDPGELAMFFSGRQSHSVVTIDGPPDVADRLRRARLGV